MPNTSYGLYELTMHYYIAFIIISAQLLYLFHVSKNCRYGLKKAAKQRDFMPKTALIVPCKNLDVNFQENIKSLILQDFDNFEIFFVVESAQDRAWSALCRLRDDLAQRSKAGAVHILQAGHSSDQSQKLHNLLFAVEQVGPDFQVLAFADSDIAVSGRWLRHLVGPLKYDKTGVASGYRWFVPVKNNAPTLILSSMNARVAQQLGNTRFNQVWGGSMAVRREDFQNWQMSRIWQRALSDDLSLSNASKRAGKKVIFCPGALAASYETVTWAGLFEFARRQFLITRINSPLLWLLALALTGLAAAALWGGVVFSFLHGWYWPVITALVACSQIYGAFLRQFTAARLLEVPGSRLLPSAAADIACFWLVPALMLIMIMSSAAGRTIRWRGIRYKMVSAEQTEILGRNA